MRDLLASSVRPETQEAGVELLHDAFRTVVGVGLHDQVPDEQVYKEEFNTGGMSGGHIHLPTWRERLMPLLESRLLQPQR
jgi:hypothetical protein